MIDKNEFQNLINQYIENKITIDSVAKQLGIHKSTVWRVAKKQGIKWVHKPRKRRLPLDVNEMIRLYEIGHTTVEIANILNTKEYLVGRRLKEHYGRNLHPTLHNAVCKHCKCSFNQETAKERYNRTYTLVCLDCNKKARALAKKRIKKEIIEGYGGKCNCCGETTFEFLTIDHRNGRKRDEIGIAGTMFYYYLRRQGFPKDEYQLLCINCNFAKGIYGKCPHEL